MSVHGLLATRINQIRDPWSTALLGKLPVPQIVIKFTECSSPRPQQTSTSFDEANQSTPSIIFLENPF